MLEQNYPNPFNPTTKLSFVIGHSSFASLKVYDVLGREVATIVDGFFSAGRYTRTFDARLRPSGFGGQASGLASGVYFYRLTTPAFTAAKQMVVIK